MDKRHPHGFLRGFFMDSLWILDRNLAKQVFWLQNKKGHPAFAWWPLAKCLDLTVP